MDNYVLIAMKKVILRAFKLGIFYVYDHNILFLSCVLPLLSKGLHFSGVEQKEDILNQFQILFVFD